MNLQEWDNSISILSNATTALGVVAGLIFGRKKLNEIIKNKKTETAFNAAIVFHEVVEKNGIDIVKIKHILNSVITICDNSIKNQQRLTKDEYYNLLTDHRLCTELSSNFFNSFVKLAHYKVMVKQKAVESVSQLIHVRGEITTLSTKIFTIAAGAAHAGIITAREMDEILSIYTQLDVPISKANDISSSLALINFDDFFDF
jgi:hypothetical protein